jgi:dTMP kinase
MPSIPASQVARFITFEGIDGAGKSTQIDALVAELGRRSVPFVRTREPGGTDLGEELRTLMLGRPMSPLTETLLMFAARHEHVEKVIAPALARGQWVLCDRFTDASYAYQGAGRGVATDRIDELARWVQGILTPDLTVIVDIDPAVAQLRLAGARVADRFESEPLAFFAAVRGAYLARARASAQRYLVVDGSQPAERQALQIFDRIRMWLT